MAVGPVVLNGTIQRVQDVGAIKQQEDSKPLVEQQNIQTTFNKETEQQLKQVHHANDSDEPEFRYDARDKGKNEYEGQGSSKKKQKKKEGKVVLKNQSSHFDIKI